MNKQTFNSILTAGLLTASAANADLADTGLYDNADPNSAFLRIVSLGENPRSAMIDGEQLVTHGHCTTSKTLALKAGDKALAGDGWQWEGTMAEGQVYTLVVNGDEATTFTHKAERDLVRANFAVYNLQQDALAVHTTGRKHTVFKDVDGMSRVERPLNPLRVTFEISDSNTSTELSAITFSRGKTTNLFVCDGASDSLVSLVVTD